MCGEQIFKRVNDDSGVACQRPQGVTQWPILGKQVWHTLVNHILEGNGSTHREGTLLSGDIFGLLRTRGGKVINDKLFL